MTYKNKNCERCGIEYSPNSSVQKYCFKCGIINKKEKRREYKQIPQNKVKERARQQKPEFKESRRKYRQRPEVKKRKKEYQQNPENKNRTRHLNLVRNYDLTLKEFNEKLKKQGGTCEICRKGNGKNRKKPSTDHNHKTGKVRGILCGNCNFELGTLEKFNNNLNLFKIYIKYLEEHGTKVKLKYFSPL